MANHNQQKARIVKMTNSGRQRIRKPRQGLEDRSDTILITATPFRIWDTIKQFHPNKNEILNVVRVLNSIGANCNIIAATLDLQGWNNFSGVYEWTTEDVKDILESYRA